MSHLLIISLLASSVLVLKSPETPLASDERIKKAVVMVRSFDSQNNVMLSGNGFLVDAQGHVATAYHIIKAAQHLDIRSFERMDFRVKRGVAASEITEHHLRRVCL